MWCHAADCCQQAAEEQRALGLGCPPEVARKCLKEAKDMTKEEFRNKLCRMMWHLDFKLQQVGSSTQEFLPLLSFDHNGCQKYADLQFSASELPPGIETCHLRELFWPLPSYSPDCHRVIEHIFGQLSNKLHKELLNPASTLTDAPSIAQWLLENFQELSPMRVHRDVSGLPELYKWIVDNDGAWAPRGMR